MSPWSALCGAEKTDRRSLVRQLEHFATLNQERHLAKAAAVCYVSQPAWLLSVGQRSSLGSRDRHQNHCIRVMPAHPCACQATPTALSAELVKQQGV
jgi:hypothetical protein